MDIAIDRGLTPISFEEQFSAAFKTHFPGIRRLADRLSGDPHAADDLAQEAFVRLFRRGSLPESPAAWLATVALNLFRNDHARRGRRLRLLTPAAGERAHSDPEPSPSQQAEASDEQGRVRQAMNRLSERERHLLLLRAEGYSYRDLAATLDLNEASVGTLLARAKRAFLMHYGEDSDAS